MADDAVMADVTSDAPGAKEKAEEVFEPNMALAQEVFRQSTAPSAAGEASVRKAIEAGFMAPYYVHVCALFGWAEDAALLARMRSQNAAEEAYLAAKEADAVANQGDMEVLDALFDAVRFHARIGAKEAAFAAADAIRDRPKISTGKRIDAVMMKIRVSLFYVDVAACKDQLAEAKKLAADGGDWDRNNRLRARPASPRLEAGKGEPRAPRRAGPSTSRCS